MPYVITQPCIGSKDTSCYDVCPVDAIHPTPDSSDFEAHEQLYIDPIDCIECGACVAVCPVEAIFSDDEVPEKWKSWIAINKEYFEPDR
ncbi:4Fe-4S dicluster domain-containing protein [Flindersiella endophytica]